MEDKKRILLVTRNLPPLVGGMERLNWHMLKELSQNHIVSAVGPKISAHLVPTTIKFHTVPLSPLWLFITCSFIRTVSVAIKWKPDQVMAGSGLTAPIAWIAARLSGARAVAYLHGLDIVVANPLYRWLWLPFIRHMDHVVVNSRATAVLAAEAGISKKRIGIVHPGVTLPEAVSLNNGDEFRKRFNLGDDPIILSVGRLTERKGIREFVRSSLPEIVKHHPGVTLVIIGGEAENALAAHNQSMDSIQAAAKEARVGGNIKFLGKISDDDLSLAFKAATVHVFPVRELSGDPEGFGMVAIEAAAYGVPTIAFACGGVIDAVKDGVTGTLINPEDYCAFANAVKDHIKAGNSQQWRSNCKRFASSKSWPAFRINLERELTIAIRKN